MNSFKDEIIRNTKKLKQEMDVLRKMWTDDVARKFFSLHVESIISGSETYSRQAEVIFDKMQRTLDQLSKLCGEPSSRFVFSGNPNERGDRAGGTSSSFENTSFYYDSSNKENY